MYVTTFYSYKGGVGRTMALINVAFLLARAGKKVLLVDFDLEAPGIPSFDQFRCAGSQPGIVDYVTAFRDSGAAPDVSDFIFQCVDGDDLPIWLMPAGRHTQPGYAEKLYSIDWKDLYDHHEGYLMFEDMRNQWKAHEANFDYVLIDSRTGHTDVGGICTRQLPDAVVVMFLPNEQNISGLTPIVSAIREEKTRPAERKVTLHFCPSNVPDLDDEDDILRSMLNTAKDSLGPPAAVIHHYNSLDLLNQPAFVASRPNSKLSRQYHSLMNAIIERNFADAAGAEAALKGMPDRYEAARRAGDQDEIEDIERSAERIAFLHPENGKIGWHLSILYSRMGAIDDEYFALTTSIDHDYERGRALIRRARLLSSINRQEQARDDLLRVLGSGTATSFEILPAIDLLRAIEPKGWVAPIEKAIDQLQGGVPALWVIMRSLMAEREKLPLAVKVGQKAASLQDPVDPAIRNHLILAAIGLGQFELAMDIMERQIRQPNAGADFVFNYAIAKWGQAGTAPIDMFQRAVEAIDRDFLDGDRDANIHQCFAMAHMVLGNWDSAFQALESARACVRVGKRVFSCWRYLEMSGRDMLKDLEAMENAVGEPFEPQFFAEVKRLVQ